jgi:tetratricopeptide (TPR) repeat protein
LPFVLLLLDYWPLGRFSLPSSATFEIMNVRSWRYHLPPRQLILEKVPLLALSVASCVATLLAQKKIILPIDRLPLLARINNALLSAITYMWQMIWPTKLAVFYPYSRNRLSWEVILAAALLAAITVAFFALIRKRPYLAVGWLWYLGMLVPVIGLIQVGSQAHADRYTYLPQIGLYLAVTWTVADVSASWRWLREILGVGAGLIITALMLRAYTQTSYWRDSESLWAHALAVTPDNEIARYNFGSALGRKGRLEEGIAQLQRALQIDPNLGAAHNNLAIALSKKGRLDEAIAHYQEALEIEPNHAVTEFDLGNAFLKKGQLDQAIAHYEKALEIEPSYPEAHSNLGNVLLQKGQVEEAIAHYRKALETKPDHAGARHNLPFALLKKGRVNDALAYWRERLAIQPYNVEARNDLAVTLLQTGHAKDAIAQWQKILEYHADNVEARISIAWVLATSPEGAVRDGAKAVDFAEQARQLSGENNPIVFRTLAAALAECGRFAEAIDRAQRGLQSATLRNNSELMEKLQSEIKLYQANSPMRDAGERTSKRLP